MTTALEILEALYEEFDKDRKNYATSEMPLAYLDGKCDAIDLAISAIQAKKLIEMPEDVCEELREPR